MTPAPANALPPQSVGPFRILGTLGRGGYGAVHLAEREGQKVALKMVAVPGVEQLASIRAEIHALVRISQRRHPGIVSIVAEGVHEGLPWYAMDLVEGEPLRAWARRLGRAEHHLPEPPQDDSPGLQPTEVLADGPRAFFPAGVAASAATAPRLLGVLCSVCDALAFLHGEGVVHRDLKPDNVLVRPDGQPVLVDFGLSTAAGSTRETLQMHGAVVGTIAYMAPEQCRGEAADARADLYAVGCLVYELLTGHPPFTGQGAMQVLHRHLSEPAPRLSDEVPWVDAGLDDLVARLLAKDPRDRLGFAEDVARALVEAGAAATRLPGPEPRPYLYRPRLAGRDALLAELVAIGGGLDEGRGRLVLLRGESGAGKTRLAKELAAALHGRVTVLAGECSPGVGSGRAGDVPLEPLRASLRTMGDRCRERGAGETARLLGPRLPVLALYEPTLLTVPGAGDYGPPADLPGEAAVERVVGYVSDVLHAHAEASPTLLVLDDLQWADELTLRWLHVLARGDGLGRTPLFVLGTYRSEETTQALGELRTLPAVVERPVERLQAGDLARVAADMLAMEDVPPGFAAFLHESSEGNPFFVAEYLRAAVALGLVSRGHDGRWRVAEGGEALGAAALPLPAALRDLVGRRLDGLQEAARDVVAAAATLGREMSTRLLQATASLEDDVLEDAIATLERQQVLETSSPGQHRFVHDKIREVAYGRLDDDERRRLHARAADSLARVEGEAALAAIARHRELAGDREAAAEAYLAAARRARDAWSFADAASLYESHLALRPEHARAREELAPVYQSLGRLKDALASRAFATEAAEERRDLASVAANLAGTAELLVLAGRNEEAAVAAARALTASEQAERGRGRALVALGNVAYATSRIAEALEHFRAAETALRLDGDATDRLRALVNIANCHHLLGDLAEAGRLRDVALDAAREARAKPIQGLVYANMAVAENDRGNLAGARRLFESALVLHREVGDRRGEARAFVNLGLILEQQGDRLGARTIQRRALALVRELGDGPTEGTTLVNLANNARDGDELAEAQALYAQARDVCTRVGYRRGVAMVDSHESVLRLKEGRLEEAVALAEQAAATFEALGDARFHGALLAHASNLARYLGRFDDSADLLERAEVLLARVGDRMVLLDTVVTRGHLALARGKPARDLLRRAEEEAAALGLSAESSAMESVAVLARAVAGFEAGKRLLRGTRPKDLPPLLRARLRREIGD